MTGVVLAPVPGVRQAAEDFVCLALESIDMSNPVLVVEDQADIAALLVRTLEREGHAVTLVDNGQGALDHLAVHPVDAMILDLGLPDLDGLEVCRLARERGYEGGIMIVTARGLELDRVVGLDVGADDYLAKPFSLAELHARLRALLRRTARATVPAAAVPAGRLRLDRGARRVYLSDSEIALTGKEFDVLAALADKPGEVVSREQLMSDVWDENWFGSTKTLDVTIGRLRHKLEGVQITNLRGVGFRLEDDRADA